MATWIVARGGRGWGSTECQVMLPSAREQVVYGCPTLVHTHEIVVVNPLHFWSCVNILFMLANHVVVM